MRSSPEVSLFFLLSSFSIILSTTHTPKSIMADTALAFPVNTTNTAQDAAVLEKATIESLRNVQHKDCNGNLISKYKYSRGLHVYIC